MAKPVSKPDQDFNDYAQWCHLIMCGLDVVFEDCRKCNPKERKS